MTKDKEEKEETWPQKKKGMSRAEREKPRRLLSSRFGEIMGNGE